MVSSSFTIQASNYSMIYVCMQEGFASEVKASWLVRIYFMSFFIVMLVILQVVISFIVDEFKFKVLDTAKERVCPEHGKSFEYCRCKRCEYLGLLTYRKLSLISM